MTQTTPRAMRRVREMYQRWQDGYAFNEDSDYDVALAERVDAELASAPVPASGGADAVAVKALEWKRKPHGDDWYADCVIGRYEVGLIHVDYIAILRTVDGNDANDLRLGFKGGLETAKAAAQADYETRIRSALSPAATAVSEARGDPFWDSPPGRWDEGDHNEEPYPQALAKPASSPAGGDVVEGLRAEIAHDGFSGDIIGRYVTREGKRGAVVQQDGTRVVHVYGEKWLPVETQLALSQSTSAGRVGE